MEAMILNNLSPIHRLIVRAGYEVYKGPMLFRLLIINYFIYKFIYLTKHNTSIAIMQIMNVKILLGI